MQETTTTTTTIICQTSLGFPAPTTKEVRFRREPLAKTGGNLRQYMFV